MSSIEKTSNELRLLVKGAEKAQVLAAAADSQAQQVARHAAGAGFAAVAAGMVRVRNALSQIQLGLNQLSNSIGEAITAAAAVPREATPAETIAGLAAMQTAVDGIRDHTAETVTQVQETQQLVAMILQGGQPGPMLSALANLKQVLVLLVQGCGQARQVVEAAITEARQLGGAGKLTGAGGHLPTSPVSATAGESPAPSPGTAASDDNHVGTVWTRRPTGVPGGAPTGRRTRIPPNERGRERRSLELENECADTVARKGYRVHQNPTGQEISDARLMTGDVGDPRRSPDYLIEGHVFDCYSPTAPIPVRAVWTAVSKKVSDSQTQRVVLNLHDWRGEIGALQEQFDAWPVQGLKELVAVRRDGAIIQIVRRD